MRPSNEAASPQGRVEDSCKPGRKLGAFFSVVWKFHIEY